MDIHLAFDGRHAMSADVPFVIGTNGIRRFRSCLALHRAAMKAMADQSRAGEAHRLVLRKAAMEIAEGAEETEVEAPLPWERGTDPRLIPALDVTIEWREGTARVRMVRMKAALRRDAIDPIELIRMIR